MDKNYQKLFEPLRIGKHTLRNRIFLAPMGEGMANPDGSVSDQAIGYYTEYAKGGSAVITPGVVSVDYPNGKPEKLIMRIDDQKYIKDMNRMAESIHRYGGLLIPQLHHAGAQTDKYITEGMTPRCVSDVDVETQLIMTHRAIGPQSPFETAEIKQLVEKFINAALYCQLAGCDGIALHSAHGYLFNQFLSPATNKRIDEYGGSFDNRIRFSIEVISGIRKVCGPNFIIGARIPGHEWISNGLTDDECDEIARRYVAAGCDYFDVSGGMTADATNLMETDRYEEGDRVKYAARIKKAVNVPVGAVGKLRHPDYCEKVLEEGQADFIVMGRTLICDPYWPEKVKTGKVEEIRPCLSCFDGCTGRLFRGCGVGCALNPRRDREFDLGEIRRTENPKKLAVIGGGPGGMEAAITAAERGHHVTLIEKSNELGGQLNLACVPPHKEAIREARDWFAAELQRKGVEVIKNTEATVDLIKRINPDQVVLATGAKPVTSIPVPGIEHTIGAWDVLAGKYNIPEEKEVTIIGGGIVGCEVAELLLTKKNAVTIIEMKPSIADGLEPFHLMGLYGDFVVNNVRVETNATVKSIESNKVLYSALIADNRNKGGDVLKQSHVLSADEETQSSRTEERSTDADIIILAVGQISNGNQLGDELSAAGYDVVAVGDAVRPAKIIDAVREGYFAGINL